MLTFFQAAIQNYFQASRVAHNIKDLEKHLPSVASINGMQVKGTVTSLSLSLVFLAVGLVTPNRQA